MKCYKCRNKELDAFDFKPNGTIYKCCSTCRSKRSSIIITYEPITNVIPNNPLNNVIQNNPIVEFDIN